MGDSGAGDLRTQFFLTQDLEDKDWVLEPTYFAGCSWGLKK